MPKSEENLRKRKKLVGDEDMEEMYGGAIKGDISNHCFKCMTCGDLVNHRKYRWNNREDNDQKTEDNEEYERQSEGDEDDRQSVMTDDEDDNSDDESEPDYGGPKCSEFGRPKMGD